VNVNTRQPLRVLFALPGLHRINRGAEVVLEEIATRAAADPGFDVTIFGSGPPHAERPYRYRKLHCLRREVFEKFPRFPYVRDPYEWEELSFAPALFWNYSPADYDLTVTCGYPYTNWLLRRGRNGSRRPAHVFVTQNGDWMVQARNWEYKHFGCDALICTNPEYYARHKDKYPCALIPNGVDTARFHPGDRDRAREQFGLPPGVPVILIVSALTPSKRVLDGIRAAAAIPGAHLVVAGDGEQRAAVDALGNELLKDRFRRMTFGRAAMPDLYRAADVLLHMSREEPFGNIYVEALATGLPIVAHESAVTRWILDDQATLVDTADPAAVVSALAASLNDRTAEGITARRALAEKRYAWDAVAEQYCAFFRGISC
jgi:glycosyltransferase involved in cell wall biosynthesis